MSDRCVFIWYYEDGVRKKFAVVANCTKELEVKLVNQCKSIHPQCEVEIEREGDERTKREI